MPAESVQPMNAPGKVALPQLLGMVAILALAAFAAYSNSFKVPFIFDDEPNITENTSIRDLKALGAVLAPSGVTIGGRPVANLSLALNYAWSGEKVWSYHVVNLTIHVLVALALFGVVRRTLRSTNLADRYGEFSLPLSFLITLLWTVHPLQTGTVTYISQRAEALMVLFYLLTLYGFIRSVEPGGSAHWLWLSVGTCFCGVMTKEVMVTAPVMVLLYDRVFCSPSFGSALSKRRWYYAALVASWGLLAYLMISSHLGTRSVGFNTRVSPWDYALTEFKVVVWYAKLALWPDPLVFDYGPDMVEHRLLPVAPYMLLVLAGLAGTVWLFVRGRKELGFTAAAFFILLSPTSSFVPIAEQPMAESRMYLPLALFIALGVLGLHGAFKRTAWYGLAGLAVLLAVLSVIRNRDYQSLVSIWGDAVAKFPLNSRAQFNFANELGKIPGREAESLPHYEAAIRIKSDYPGAYNNYANKLAHMPGRAPEAIANYEKALRIKPDYAIAHNNLATELAKIPGRAPEAISHYEAAIRSKPDYADAHFNLAISLSKIPARVPEAITHYEAALRLNPNMPEAHHNLALLLLASPGRKEEALAHYEAALRLKPDFLLSRNNLANELDLMPGREADAITHFEQILRLKPDDAVVHFKLANKLAKMPGRLPEALTHYEAALRLRPDFEEAHYNYANKLAALPGQALQAVAHYEAALRLKPGHAEAHNNLATVLAKIPGRQPEALAHYEAAARAKPSFADAHYNLAVALARMPGREAEAMTHFEAALSSSPDLAEAHNGLALLLAKQGQPDQAVRHLQLALTLKPAFKEARANLDRIQAERASAK